MFTILSSSEPAVLLERCASPDPYRTRPTDPRSALIESLPSSSMVSALGAKARPPTARRSYR